MMIDILLAAASTRLGPRDVSRPPDLSRTDRNRFVLGLVGIVVLFSVLAAYW